MAINGLGGAFQMSNRENKNCSELLLTNGMGLDRAPDEFQKLVFLKPPTVNIVNHYNMNVVTTKVVRR